jgi:hypothetical protein
MAYGSMLRRVHQFAACLLQQSPEDVLPAAVSIQLTTMDIDT